MCTKMRLCHRCRNLGLWYIKGLDVKREFCYTCKHLFCNRCVTVWLELHKENDDVKKAGRSASKLQKNGR